MDGDESNYVYKFIQSRAFIKMYSQKLDYNKKKEDDLICFICKLN